jgi:hypothetical protein
VRVRLIFPFVVEIAQLDTALTEAATTGPGYDDVFREQDVTIIDGKRVTGRQERAPVRFPAQIEDRTWEALKMFDAGNSPQIGMGIVADVRHLRHKGLVDPETGRIKLNVNDRLVAIYDKCDRPVSIVRTPPGLFCVEVRPFSYGIGRTLNLVLMLFEDRERSVT